MTKQDKKRSTPLHPKGTLRIQRKKTVWAHRLSKYAIFVDGIHIGDIKNGETWSYLCPEGPHKLRLTCSAFFSSHEIEFTISTTGGPAEFECQPNPESVFFWFIFIFKKNDWISLKQTA